MRSTSSGDRPKEGVTSTCSVARVLFARGDREQPVGVDAEGHLQAPRPRASAECP
jgi:hypothetical protein